MECPVCAAYNVYHLRFIKLRGSRTGKCSPLFFCKQCDSLFQRPDYHEDDEALKGDLQWHLSQRPNRSHHVKALLQKLKEISPRAKNFLDIGCGIGTSVLVAKDMGFDAQGVEPNLYAVRYAEDNFSLNLIHGYFQANILDKKFDIVIADNVLEHVPAPRDFIRDVFSVLSRGGVLYLAVPDRKGGILRVGYSLLFATAGDSIFADNDVHINHFSRKSILKLIEPYGAILQLELRAGAYIIQAKK